MMMGYYTWFAADLLSCPQHFMALSIWNTLTNDTENVNSYRTQQPARVMFFGLDFLALSLPLSPTTLTLK